MGAVLRARQRPGAFAPLEHFAEGKISPQGGFTPPEDFKKRGPRQRLRWWGGTAPPWLGRRQSPPPRRWPRKADSKRKTAAPTGAAVLCIKKTTRLASGFLYTIMGRPVCRPYGGYRSYPIPVGARHRPAPRGFSAVPEPTSSASHALVTFP